MTPQRIQQRRTAGWRKPEGAVAVGRPGKWGNPWMGGADRDHAYRQFRRYIRTRNAPWSGWADLVQYPSDEGIRSELRGKDLMCWCPLPEPGEPDTCHAAILIEIANSLSGRNDRDA